MSKKHKKSDKKGNVFDPKSPASKALAIALSGAMVTAGTPLPVFAAENQSVSQPSEPDTSSTDEAASTAASTTETSTATTTETAPAPAAAETTSETAAAAEEAAPAAAQESASESAAETSESAAATTETAPAAAATATEETAAAEDTKPAQELEESVAVDTDTVTVHVSAPEGALPKGAKLVLTAVKDDLSGKFADLVSAGNEVSALKAVKVSYVAADGSAVTPAAAVTITLTDADPSADATTLYSMASEAAAPVKEDTLTAGKATATSSATSAIYVLESEKAAPAASDDAATSKSTAETPAAEETDTTSEDAKSEEATSEEETSESEQESTSTSTASVSALTADVDSLLGVNTLAATPVEAPTVTLVNDNTGATSTGQLSTTSGSIASAAAGLIPSGYTFSYASVYNTNVESFTVGSDGSLLCRTANGEYVQIKASTGTDLQIHYRGSVKVTYKYVVDGAEVSAASAGSLVAPSGITPNGTATIKFKPATGLSINSVTTTSGSISGSNGTYTLSGATSDATVTINLSSQHTLTFANSSNTYLTYGGTTLNSKTGGSLSYTTGNSVSFQLSMYNQWSSNAKVLNKLTITLASGEVMANIPPTNGTATTSLSDGTTIKVVRSGDSTSPRYTVTITAASGKNVYGNISVSTNYKDQDTSEVWVNQLVGVDYVTSDNGTANHVDGNKLYPGIFDFYVRDTRYSSSFTFTVKDGYTLSDSGVTITARDQDGNLLTNTSGHYKLTQNWDGSYTITIGADARGWQPKDIRISIVATPDATTTYTTSFDGTAASASYKYGESFTIPENTTMKQGQHFTGWVLDGDTSGKVYKPGDTFTIDSSNVAYASNGTFKFVSQWTQNGEANITLKVVVNKDDGTSETIATEKQTVATGAGARVDESEVESLMEGKYGANWAATYEALNSDQFDVSSVTDGQVITIQYCAKMTIDANSYSGEYDGNAHSVSATASIADAKIEYSTDDGATWSTTAPSRTDVGTTSVKIRASKDGYKTVETDASIAIQKRDVTLTSASHTWTYDGQAHSDQTVTPDGFVDGEGATYTVTGSITDAGSVDNDFTYTLNSNTKADNYNITKSEGTLTVTAGDISDADTFTVSQPADTIYNGQEQKQPVSVTFTKGGAAVDPSDYAVSYSDDVTDAGEVTVTIKGQGNLSGQVTRTYHITPAPLTVTTESATKSYDGTALAASGSLSGLVNDETATVTATGTQTAVGSSQNTYSIAWGTAKASNYSVTENLGTLTVTAGDISDADTFTVSQPADTIYNGQEQRQPVSVTFTKGGDAVDASSYDVTYTPAVDAGTVTVTVTGKGNLTGSVTRTYEIEKRDVTLTSATDSKTYDGTPLTNDGVTVSGDGFVSGEGASYSVTGTITNAGSVDNDFTYTLNDNTKAGNYNITAVKGTLTVNKADSTTVHVTGNTGSFMYDGTKKSVTGWNSDAASVDGSISIALKDGASATATGTNVGTYHMGLTADDFEASSPNFETINVEVTDGSLTITNASYKATVTGQSGSAVYDGQEHELTGITTTGLLAGQTLSGLTYSAKGTNAGSYTGTFTGTPQVKSADGTDQTENYVISQNAGTLTITAAEINPDTPDPNNPDQKRFTITAPEDVTYNGQSQQQKPTVHDATTGKDLVEGTDYTLSYSDDTTNVGTVTVTITGKGNYSGSVETHYQIKQAKVVVKAADASKNYGEKDPSFTATVSGLVNGESESLIKYDLTRDEGEAKGTYAIKASGEASQGNYSVTYENGTLTINAAEINPDTPDPNDPTNPDAKRFTISKPADVVYNGLSQQDEVTVHDAATGKDLVLGTDYTLTYSDDTTNVGTVTVTVNGIGNYSGTVAQTYQITPATLTVTTPSATKAYDGTPLTAQGTVTGLVNNETVTFATTGTQTAVGSSENTYTLAFDQTAKESNYTVSATTGTLTVSAGNIADENAFTVSQPEDTTYNGLEQKQPVTVSFKNGGSVDASDYDISYSPAVDAGEVTVTITGKGNLTGTVTRTYKINKATLTVTTPDASKAYDGTALTAAGSITGFVNNETATFTTTGSQTEVGSSENTYSIDWNGSAKESNYAVSATTGTLEVTKGDISKYVTLTPADVTVTYDGTAHTAGAATATDTNNNKLTIEYSTDGETWTTNPADIAATNVLDSTTVQIRVSAGNYEGYLTGTEQLTINKAPVTIKTGTAEKAYDGTPLTNDQIEVDGLQNGETVSVATTGTITEPGSTPNAYSITWASEASAAKHGIASFIQSLFAAPAAETTTPTAKQSNYEVTNNLGTLTVTKASIDSTDGRFTVEGLTDVKYDGTSHEEKPVVTDTTTGDKLVEGIDYELSYSDDTVNAGTVTVTVTTLPTSKHYTGSVSRTYEILKRDVTLTSASDKKSYDGTPLTNGTVTATGEGFADGEGAAFDVTGTITNVGTVKNAFTYTLNDNTKAGNYNITTDEGTLTVTAGNIADKNAFTVSQPEDTVYNGQEQKQPVTVSFKNGGAVDASNYDISYTPAVDAGTVTVTITGKGNLTGSITRTYEIAQKGYTVTTEGATKDYDGTALTASGTVDGIVEGETYTFKTTGSQTEAGSSDNTYTLTFDGTAKAGNYKLEGETLGKLTVNAAEINPDTPDPNDPTNPDAKRFTISEPTDTVYNGLSQEEEITVRDAATGKDLVLGTDYTLTYDGDTTNVTDEGVTVTVTGIGNYSGTVAQTYKITQATLDVYTPSATKTYDGTPLTDSKDAHVDGLQNGETVDLQVTGSQTEVGSSDNTFSLAWTGTAQEKNYKVVKHLGTLTITEAPATPEPQKPETPKAEPEQAKVEAAKVPDTSDTNAQAPVGFMAALSAALMAMGVHLRRKSRDDEE